MDGVLGFPAMRRHLVRRMFSCHYQHLLFFDGSDPE
jgi:hypothetical protein